MTGRDLTELLVMALVGFAIAVIFLVLAATIQ